jgi:hypothetical protein
MVYFFLCFLDITRKTLYQPFRKLWILILMIKFYGLLTRPVKVGVCGVPPPIRSGQNPRINESSGKAQIASGKHTKSY